MSNPNTDRDERVRQIRERVFNVRSSSLHRDDLAKTYLQALDDTSYLLSLLDSQAALTGFGKPEDEARRILTYAKDWIGNDNYRVLHGVIVRSLVGLQSRLDKAERERDDLRVIVDAVTDDDPGTALSKLHKIQHDAATRMRDRCVEKVKAALADEQRKWSNGVATTDYELGQRAAFTYALSVMESLTLEGEQKQ